MVLSPKSLRWDKKKKQNLTKILKVSHKVVHLQSVAWSEMIRRVYLQNVHNVDHPVKKSLIILGEEKKKEKGEKSN